MVKLANGNECELLKKYGDVFIVRKDGLVNAIDSEGRPVWVPLQVYTDTGIEMLEKEVEEEVAYMDMQLEAEKMGLA